MLCLHQSKGLGIALKDQILAPITLLAGRPCAMNKNNRQYWPMSSLQFYYIYIIHIWIVKQYVVFHTFEHNRNSHMFFLVNTCFWDLSRLVCVDMAGSSFSLLIAFLCINLHLIDLLSWQWAPKVFPVFSYWGKKWCPMSTLMVIFYAGVQEFLQSRYLGMEPLGNKLWRPCIFDFTILCQAVFHSGYANWYSR